VPDAPRLLPIPCSTCPYRKDTPPGIWAPEEYEKLPAYDGQRMELAPFHCHQETASGVPTYCRGWVSCHGFDAIAIRLACASGRMDPAEVERPCHVPLYSTGKEACEAGLAGIRRPTPKALRAIERLQRKGVARGYQPALQAEPGKEGA
jgi:hypothetical protein